MKLIRNNGRELTVRDVGPVIYRLTASGVPIKATPWVIVEDDVARELLRALRATGLYEGGRVDA